MDVMGIFSLLIQNYFNGLNYSNLIYMYHPNNVLIRHCVIPYLKNLSTLITQL